MSLCPKNMEKNTYLHLKNIKARGGNNIETQIITHADIATVDIF